jgi:hypothetical protein
MWNQCLLSDKNLLLTIYKVFVDGQSRVLNGVAR